MGKREGKREREGKEERGKKVKRGEGVRGKGVISHCLLLV